MWVPYVADNYPSCHDPKRIFVSPRPVAASAEVKQSCVIDGGGGRPLLATASASVPERNSVATKNLHTLRSTQGGGGGLAALVRLGEQKKQALGRARSLSD